MRNAVDILVEATAVSPNRTALVAGKERFNYDELLTLALRTADGFAALGVSKGDRIAVVLDKQVEAVLSPFGAMACGAICVPVNPLLKPAMITNILIDSGARILVTTSVRYRQMQAGLEKAGELRLVILVDSNAVSTFAAGLKIVQVLNWSEFLPQAQAAADLPDNAADDAAIIFYTSGSTGNPKGVVFSHGNIISGAESVVAYLRNDPNDNILCLLPLSFDAGFSQLTTAFLSNATAVLMNYVLPGHVPPVCARENITGITGIPPLWHGLVSVDWPCEARQGLRYFANTGGHLHQATLNALRRTFSNADPYLMYGLTEAFRSTYLDPRQVDSRPGSIGKAIPNARVLVLRPDAGVCEAGEIGELVHFGPTVAKGYWNAPELTAGKFRKIPANLASGTGAGETGVWSGDLAWRDAEGFLHFVGREDDMIKSSGYRISPTEVEETLRAVHGVSEAIALGIPEPVLGHTITAVLVADSQVAHREGVLNHCRRNLPAYMIPSELVYRQSIPKSPNGKYDRRRLRELLLDEGVGA